MIFNYGATKVVLNAKSILNDIDGDLLEFLNYVIGKKSNNEFVRKIDAKVELMKHSKRWRNDYMRYQIEIARIRQEGFEQGIMQGIEQGIMQGIEQGKKEKTLDGIKNIIKNINVSVEEAMNILEIPAAERPFYLSLINE